MGKAVANEAELAFLYILLNGVQELLLRNLWPVVVSCKLPLTTASAQWVYHWCVLVN